MEAQRAVEEAEMLGYMDEVKQGEYEPEPSYASVHPAPRTDIMDISDDEDYLR